MKRFLLLFTASLFCFSCSTIELYSYKKGDVIALKEGLTRQPISKELKITLSNIDNREFRIDLVDVSTSFDSWVDKYQEVAVYKKRCNSFFLLIVDKEDKDAQCIFFINYVINDVPENYVLMNYIGDSFGFVEEPTKSIFIESKSETITEEEKLNLDSLDIEVGGKRTNILRNGEIYSLAYSQLNTTAFKVFNKAISLVLNNKTKVDITELYKDLIRKNIYEKEKEDKRLKSLPSSVARRHNIKLCEKDSLGKLLRNGHLVGLEQGCLYKLYSDSNYPYLKVLQVTHEGLLTTCLDPYGRCPSYFIKTRKSFVDGQLIRNMYFKYIGPLSYTTVLGGMKTVHGFQFLEDLD